MSTGRCPFRCCVLGLNLLVKIQDPDLAEWCEMFFEDESGDVHIAVFHAMHECQDIEPDLIEPLTDSSDKRIQAATIATLACHASDKKSRLPERGLKDVETCFRIDAASQLLLLEPVEDKRIYELSLYDNNPDVAQVVRKLTTGKGYSELKWWCGRCM